MNPKRTWRANGGASLKTYFIGRCLMEFPDAYLRWRRSERPSGNVNLCDAVADDGRHADDPADLAVASARIDELLNVETRVMFELQQRGYSLAEVAEMLTDAGHPHTEASVRTRMSRARATARAS